MYRSLLVPLDGSAFGEHALPLALALARRQKAALQIVHAHVPITGLYGEFGAFYDVALGRELMERDRAYLDGVVERLAAVADVPLSAALLEGPPADAIARHAATIRADLLVLATHGRGPLARFWLGSVADALVRQASIPVLLVQPREAAPDLAQEPVVRRVLIPLDGSELAEQVLEPAVALGAATQAEYTLLRVVKQMTPASYDPTSGRVSGVRESLLKQLQELDRQNRTEAQGYLEQLAERLRARSLTVQSQVVSHEQPAAAILDDAQKNAVDLIALATHGRGGVKRLLWGAWPTRWCAAPPRPCWCTGRLTSPPRWRNDTGAGMGASRKEPPMDLAQLIEALSDPAAYPDRVGEVEVRQTHISAVFLAGPHVYKVKKPVAFGFLDFGTLARRRHYCEEEVRLNRRLAPEVYLGVVPVTRSDGGLKAEGDGEVVEWAVKMRRLPDDATLQNRLQQGQVGAGVVEALARRIASFHAHAESGPRVAAFGRFEAVAGNARENFEQSAAHVGTTVNKAVFARAQALAEEALARHRTLIEGRAERGVPRDTHGDLRLGHVYYFPDREPPDELVIIDCIEFNERFRFADPVADMAFLVMGLKLQGHGDLARAFTEAYFLASGDGEGLALVPFYTAYRAAVRGKVEGLKLARPEISEADRAVALAKARGSWLVALGELEEPGRKPCLALVGGLPGTGKSTLALALAQRAGFRVIRSDLVRKELAGDAGKGQGSSAFGDGIYTAEWNERTYAECLRRAEALLFEGKRVLVDANFREEVWRQSFLEAATRWGVPGVFLVCHAEPEVVRERLASRRGDASDADWPVYLEAAKTWEEPGPRTRPAQLSVATGGSVEDALSQATEVLRVRGLHS